MTALALGMLLRLLQSVLEGAPTLLVGVLLAGVFRHMLHASGTRRIFGHGTWRCLPQSWALGMLLPVCSLGVIPIAHEMRKAGVSTGAILAFALTAPLFNPLSLLYGLTLSTPFIVIAFAGASLVLVTLLGCGWDWLFARDGETSTVDSARIAPGWQRIAGVFWVACEYLSGSILLYYLIALSGNLLLCIFFPVGSLQDQFGQDDPLAPLIMLTLATPVYATPMTVMSQIGSMFVHGNSIGAAYTLLALGTGVNLGLLAWIARNHGLYRTMVLLVVFAACVTGIAYSLERPLSVVSNVDHPHTHAFDIYSAPFERTAENVPDMFRRKLEETSLSYERIALSILGVMSIFGLSIRLFRKVDVEGWLSRSSSNRKSDSRQLDWYLPGSVLGVLVIVGLVAASVLGCYVYYPPPSETLAAMKFIRAEAISAVASRDKLTATRNLERYDELTRRLQVGYYLRNGALSEFQRSKCRVLRGWLERCKDKTEAEEFESAKEMSHPIFMAHSRCREAFQ